MEEKKVYCKVCTNLTSGCQTYQCKIKIISESWYERKEMLGFPSIKNKKNDCKDFSPNSQGDK